MATVEDDATQLMKVLVSRGYSAGDSIPIAELQTIGTAAGIDGDDQDAAIKYAYAHGWLAQGPPPATTIITPDGWDNGNA
jgi:hypothetical protein